VPPERDRDRQPFLEVEHGLAQPVVAEEPVNPELPVLVRQEA
jgi:hypothetical protein